jgi:hypothetical protein
MHMLEDSLMYDDQTMNVNLSTIVYTWHDKTPTARALIDLVDRREKHFQEANKV